MAEWIPKFSLKRKSTSLGQGTYGEVRGYNINGKKYAVKKTLVRATRNMKEYIDRTLLLEIAVLKYCRHPNIVPLLKAYWLDDHPVMVLPWIEGTLFSRIYRTNLTPGLQDHLAYQLIAGVAYLHSLDILHRDLKPKNILVREDNHLYIADFGLSHPLTCTDNYYYDTEVASSSYRAPELFAQVDKYGLEIDIWSLAVILIEIYTTTQIFWDKPQDANFFVPEEENTRVQALIFYHLGTPEPSSQLYQLFQKNDPGIFDEMRIYDRPADPLPQVKNPVLHDLFLRMLDYEPDHRLTAEQVLRDRFWDPIRTDEAEAPMVEYSCLDNLVLRTYSMKNNFSLQTEITYAMMTILLQWLFSVTTLYDLEHQTYFYAVDIIYFFVNSLAVKKEELQLIGIAALYLADLLFEQTATIGDYVYVTDNTYTREQMVNTARLFARKLKFNYIRATALDYYSQLSSDFRPSAAYEQGVQLLILISYLPMYNEMTLEETARLALALKERVALADGDTASIQHLVARQEQESFFPFLQQFQELLLTSLAEDKLFGDSDNEIAWKPLATQLQNFSRSTI